MSTFPLKIITPSGEFYSGEVEYLGVCTTDGRIGFMRGALPRVCVLVNGRVDIKTSMLDMTAFAGNGVVNIDGDGITVITESCRFTGDKEDEKPPVVEERRNDDSASDALVYKKAKVRMASAIKNMKEKNQSDK